MRPGRRYEATHDPKALLRVSAIHFQLRNRTRLLRAAEFVPPVEVFEPPSRLIFRPRWARVIDLKSRSGSLEAAAHLFKSLLLEILAQSREKQPERALDRHYQLKLSPVINAIRENLKRRFTVVELVRMTGYSTDHFVRVFRAETGTSPKEFMIRQRMEHARVLLKESSHTVTQIADLLGYEDLGFFSRQFKECMGGGPSEFRRRRSR